MITGLYFVRHAQPDYRQGVDSTYVLSDEGRTDRQCVTEVLRDIRLDAAVSSPYRRSIETIQPCAEEHALIIHTDLRLRERDKGTGNPNTPEMFRKRWEDMHYCEKDGECLAACQKRNIEAVQEILDTYAGKNVLVGTHGTALSTILHYYDPSFGYKDFMRIIDFMPYVICMRFDGKQYCGYEELTYIHKKYHGKS